MGSRSLNGKGQFWGKGMPTVKYRDFLPWDVQKRLNRSICCLGLGRPKETHVQSCSLGGASVRYGGTLASPGKYNWTVRLRWLCGLMSNYFDHLFKLSSDSFHLISVSFYSACNAGIASAVLATAIPPVCPSVRPSHAGIVSKRRHVARCSKMCLVL